MTEPAACPHCPDGHTPPDRGSQPWSAWVAPERDGDGQPMQITVARSAGAHVAESDAQWVRERLNAPAVAVPVSPPVERAALRDRIAEALARLDAEKWGVEIPAKDHPFWQIYPTQADAVLAVLPPPADRAAVLNEAAEWFDSGGRSVSQMFGHQVAAELRRLAAEAPTTTQPEESGAALARYIADQPVSTIQSAFRVLGWPPLRFELVDDEPAAGARQDGAAQ